MQLNLQQVPFSRFGSFIAFSEYAAKGTRPAGLYLRSVHGNAGRRGVFYIETVSSGQALPAHIVATPSLLRLDTAQGTVEFCIAEHKLVRVRTQGVGVRLTFVGAEGVDALPRSGASWEINSYANQIQYLLTPLTGSLVTSRIGNTNFGGGSVTLTFNPDPKTGAGEGAIEEYHGVWVPRTYEHAFTACVDEVAEEFAAWLRETVSVPVEFTDTAALAAYANWSAVVGAEGLLKRPAMLMSKNWMTNVWSWDHCFNAMALCFHNPSLAWDQLMVMFDVQNAQGLLPDTVNDSATTWNYCKPPIHGWALRYMLEHNSEMATDERLREIYTPLARWTECWFNYRDDDGDGMPQYDHGNDSGWDNSTMFLGGVPIEGPDLSAFLILQMETLAIVATRLGNAEAAAQWTARAELQLQRMLDHCWRGDRFVAPRSGRHNAFESDSLVAYIPLILGKRLPQEIIDKLVAGLKEPGAFLTDYGLASERIQSPFYLADGYWRGPIWAPPTMLIVCGLTAVGEVDFAREITQRYCRLCTKSGFAENFDALTGASLRDPAYTWTSSVFLLLAHDLLA
jgi:hypothetical protein